MDAFLPQMRFNWAPLHRRVRLPSQPKRARRARPLLLIPVWNAAAAFYLHFGFKRFVGEVLTRYLPLGKEPG